jgi:hypothetical protein
MLARRFALIMGIAFILVGILGFLPPAVSGPTHTMGTHHDHGELLGLFPINALHNGFHVLSGIAGVLLSRSIGGARLFSRALAIVYGLLTILGLLPAPMNTTFGMIPIYGHDIWLHGVIALAAAYFGFVASDRGPDTAYTNAPPRV